MKSTQDASLRKASCRWLRFRLRTLLVLMVLLSLALGWLGNALYRIRRQRSIVAKIEAAGGKVTFEHERFPRGKGTAPTPPGSKLARRFLGDDAFARVVEVNLEKGLTRELRGSNADLRFIGELSTTQELYLGGPGFSDNGMIYAAKLKELKKLHLRDTAVTSNGLARLAALDELTDVTLFGPSVTDDMTRGLAEYRKLESVNFAFHNVTSAGLAPLSNLRTLRSITISGGSAVGDEGLAHLADLVNLGRLVVSHTAVSDRGLVHLDKLVLLESLHLHATQVTDDGLARLAGFAKLSSLSVAYTKVSDEGLVHLAKYKELRVLDLRGTQITDQGIQRLATLQNLKALTLSNPITVEGATELRARLPDCQIHVQMPNSKVIRVP